jgi:allophanate hydrolase subunit 2
MGYLLQEMVSNKLQSMHTSGVLPGTVQLTPGGQIIILMNEGQTTGGYPRIFQLTDKAKALLSQCAQGQKIKFKIL